MRLLIQRVRRASVTIDGTLHSSIGAGLLLLVGIEEADTQEDIDYLAGKASRLRVFDDEAGVMNLDVRQTAGELLVVSQFTLHASTRKGNRPSYVRAAGPEAAVPLYERFVAVTGKLLGRPVQTGVFGADMQVELVNDGPVTIWIDSKRKECCQRTKAVGYDDQGGAGTGRRMGRQACDPSQRTGEHGLADRGDR